MIRHIGVDKKPRENIGEAIARMLNELARVDYAFKVVAIVPRVVQLYGQSPRSYETSGVDIIIDTQKG